MGQELEDLTFTLKQEEMDKAASSKADGSKHDSALGISIKAAFCQKCTESVLLKLQKLPFIKEAIRKNIANGRKIYCRIKVPGVAVVA
jgi:hypothetical protein